MSNKNFKFVGPDQLKQNHSQEERMTTYDFVKKILGDINPVGETREDERRFKNLKETTELVDKLLTDIDALLEYKSRPEYSIKKAVEYVNNFLNTIGIKE